MGLWIFLYFTGGVLSFLFLTYTSTLKYSGFQYQYQPSLGTKVFFFFLWPVLAIAVLFLGIWIMMTHLLSVYFEKQIMKGMYLVCRESFPGASVGTYVMRDKEGGAKIGSQYYSPDEVDMMIHYGSIKEVGQ